MWQDLIVAEIQRARDDYAAKFNYDLKAICHDLRRQQEQEGRHVVTLPPRVVQSTLPRPSVSATG